MDVGSFSDGYGAGWRSVVGEVPVLLPESPVLVGAHVGAVTYMVGSWRAGRDAGSMKPPSAGATLGALFLAGRRNPEAWRDRFDGG
jgi:hypothetical protein